jgi:hypothetical protein
MHPWLEFLDLLPLKPMAASKARVALHVDSFAAAAVCRHCIAALASGSFPLAPGLPLPCLNSCACGSCRFCLVGRGFSCRCSGACWFLCVHLRVGALLFAFFPAASSIPCYTKLPSPVRPSGGAESEAPSAEASGLRLASIFAASQMRCLALLLQSNKVPSETG